MPVSPLQTGSITPIIPGSITPIRDMLRSGSVDRAADQRAATAGV
jgi:hypothetical protein